MNNKIWGLVQTPNFSCCPTYNIDDPFFVTLNSFALGSVHEKFDVWNAGLIYNLVVALNTFKNYTFWVEGEITSIKVRSMNAGQNIDKLDNFHSF